MALLIAAAGWTSRTVQRAGREFDSRGRAVSALLERMAAALAARDLPVLERIYDEPFRGKRLGLADLSRDRQWALPDGVQIVRIRQVPPGMARPEVALAEWRDYLDGFDRIEEVRLSLERLDRWREVEMMGIVAFELIGTPRGASRSVVDRARFRFAFEYSAQGELGLRRSSTIEGARTLAARAQFEEIGAQAGIDFVGRPAQPPAEEAPSRFTFPRFAASGIAAADYDNDGFHDLFIPDGVRSRLLHNRRDGTFEEVTQAAGLGALGGASVGLFADYDNDGHKDLFVGRLFAPNQLLHNRGDGTFDDVTAVSGFGGECCTTTASWADYDLDGDLDLYVGRYLDPRREIPSPLDARNGEPNRLYRNDGDGRFTEVSEEAGVALRGLSLGTVFGDYDNDGDPDLFVANDFGRSTLYRNRGDGSFADATVATGILAYGLGTGATMADYDNDGDLDLHVAGRRGRANWYAARPIYRLFWLNALRQGAWSTYWPLRREIRRQGGGDLLALFQERMAGNVLLRNSAHAAGDEASQVATQAREIPRRFDNVSVVARADPFGRSWGCVFADFDNDGWQDLYAATGWIDRQQGSEPEPAFLRQLVNHPGEQARGVAIGPALTDSEPLAALPQRRPWQGGVRNHHLRNMGDGTFHPIGRAAGTDLARNSRGVAVADFFNRGALDIAVAAAGDHHALLRNEVGRQGHWLAVELTGAAAKLPQGSNRDAVGARVTVQVAGLRQMRQVVLGDGHASQSSLRLHFGLGDRERVEKLTVWWPRSGRKQSFTDLPVDRIVAIEEGVEAIVERRYGEVNPSLER